MNNFAQTVAPKDRESTASILSDMEDNIYTVKNLGQVLMMMASDMDEPNCGAVSRVGMILNDVSRAIEDQWLSAKSALSDG